MNLIGQLIGFTAVGISAIIFLQKDRKRILGIKLLTDVLWAVHHFLIGNIIASATTGIAILREIIFIRKRKTVFMAIFIPLFFIPLLFTYKNITSLIPPVASAAATLGFGNRNVNSIKAFGAASSVLMLIYGAFNNSFATVVNELIVLSSIAVSVKIDNKKYKFFIGKRKRNNVECRKK